MTDTLGPYPLDSIITGDARELARAIPDASIDLIFTDPVYDRIDDYRWLAETAARVLKPDSAALVWYGIGYLDNTIIAMRDGGLSYRWQGVMWYRNREKPLHCDMGYSQYAGMLWFERGRMTSRRTMDLIGVNVFEEKDLQATNGRSNHQWGKPMGAIARWLEAFTKHGAIVFDPFTGGGTVPAVCKMLGRRYLAFEIDPATAERARERVMMTQPPLLVVEHEQAAFPFGDDDDI